MSSQPTDNAKFFMWYGIIEGTALILAVAAWYFWHENIAYLIGSVVIIALVGSTFLMPKILTPKNSADRDDSSSL